MEATGEGELSKGEEMEVVGGSCGEEKILVLVRLRPLSDKEIAKNEVSDWECINETTILFRNTLQERSMFPTAHTFDRVFGEDSPTRQVYDEGVKDIALSVVKGINSSIFAYGQTSSGKTYTMVGITEYTVAEIYDQIQMHEERVFDLKFSAMEIYNEAIRDLLTTDYSQPLRILDDPERGTIVENLIEEALRDKDHLMKLLSICEAQRKTGETSLNETSSRSHQILRLTVESSARESLGKPNSSRLAASVNFIDLAGSERASQALSVGTRLKEGCHINRSLLTLGTVVRKLSKGKHGHVNYRDSKLTRILQPCLGGNARTAIICTLSPARSHVEQSRNTLLFATCAKEVSTNAKVNVVMSDKALVKHLQRELARLESELRNPAASYTCDHVELLGEKDLQIKLLENQVRELTEERNLAESRAEELAEQRDHAESLVEELTEQRNLAESRFEDLLRTVENDQPSRELKGLSNRRKWQKGNKWEDDDSSVSESSGIEESHYQDADGRRSGTTQPFNRDEGDSLCNSTSLMHSAESNHQKKLAVVTAVQEFNDIKEVRCIEMDESNKIKISEPISLSTAYTERMLPSAMPNDSFVRHEATESTQPKPNEDAAFGTLEQNLYPDDPSPCSQACPTPDSRHEMLNTSWGSRASLTPDSSPYIGEDRSVGEATPPGCFDKNFPGRPEGLQKMVPQLNYDDAKLSRSNSQHSIGSVSFDELKSRKNTNLADEGVPSIDSFITGLKEMAKSEYNKKLADSEETGLKTGKDLKNVGLDNLHDGLETPSRWSLEFYSRQKSILELWQSCNTPLIHRTYFFLLFRGDPTDSIYMEVEQRRLSFLKEAFSQGSHAVASGQTLTLASSLKALQREREVLSRLMYRRFTVEERNELYHKWGVSLGSKRRRLQLINRLWNNTDDMNHVTESAAVVGKLIRFPEDGGGLKEMFGLSFTLQRPSRRSFGWKRSIPFVL